MMAQGRGRWVVSQTPRLQNSPYFCVFMYARAVKQKVWNEAENRERDCNTSVLGSRFARERLLRHALPISWLILRKKPTVLQSTRHLNWSQVRPFMTKRILHNGVVYVKCCIRWCSHCVFRWQVLGTRFDTFSQVPTPEFSQGISARVQGRGLVVH